MYGFLVLKSHELGIIFVALLLSINPVASSALGVVSQASAPTMVTSIDVLQSSLERHNATFETLLNLIPAKYYFVQEVSEEQVSVVC